MTLEREEDDTDAPTTGLLRAPRSLRDQAEDTEEHRRLFYVAATRAGDYLHISGDEAGRGGWLHAAVDAHEGGALRGIEPRGIELREPLAPDAGGPRDGGYRHPSLRPPADDDEQDYVPPLLARPPVIPLRASTPVTALRPPETERLSAPARRRPRGAARNGWCIAPSRSPGARPNRSTPMR